MKKRQACYQGQNTESKHPLLYPVSRESRPQLPHDFPVTHFIQQVIPSKFPKQHLLMKMKYSNILDYMGDFLPHRWTPELPCSLFLSICNKALPPLFWPYLRGSHTKCSLHKSPPILSSLPLEFPDPNWWTDVLFGSFFCTALTCRGTTDPCPNHLHIM